METYVYLVKTYPIYSAMIQFAVLGTFGEIAGKWVREKRIFKVFDLKTALLKSLGWAILAICVKYAFIGFPGYISALSAKGLLPQNPGNFLTALMISSAINLQFGPFLIILHRIIDNAIDKKSNWQNLDKALYSLLWFWIPAHTFTFMLEETFRIGLAALWSVALGIILGLYSSNKK
jgi:hypothetical protein